MAETSTKTDICAERSGEYWRGQCRGRTRKSIRGRRRGQRWCRQV